MAEHPVLPDHPLGGREAEALGLLRGREAQCQCGRTCPSEGPAIGFTDVPFFQYRGPGSVEAREACKCGFYRVAHSKPHVRLKCETFDARGPAEFDSFYCGCRGWD